MKNILVIHHSADFDGLFCREIAKQFFGDKADYFGWDYGDAVPFVEEGTELYMLDISIAELMNAPGLVWIDHHKSAIDTFPSSIKGYRIDGVAACRLAWQYFFTHNDTRNPIAGNYAKLPGKQEFVDRTVQEPLAVRLAGEYDIWDRRDPKAELFQHALRSMELTDSLWLELLKLDADGIIISGMLNRGEGVQYAKTKENESIAKHLAFTIEFEGLTFCAINAARYNSHLFTAGIKPEHDALFGFNFDGKQWRVSLYHAPGKEHHDLSKIAVKYGGGGHRGACGFKAKSLPFLQ
jgi:uncharacterized protein